MRYLLFGKNGQLGWELHRSLLPLGEIVTIDQDELDLEDGEKLATFIRDLQPNVIINSAAYTDVDRAESEPQIAKAVNTTAPGIIADQAKALGAVLVHYSTDYVFDGLKGTLYREDDDPNPLNVYAQTKLEGEKAIRDVGVYHLIFRTSWLYSLRKPSFVTKVLGWARTQEEVRVVNDQIGSPTWCRMLAEVTTMILAMMKVNSEDWLHQRSGTYHLAGKGVASRYDWAREILRNDFERNEQKIRKLIPAKSDDFQDLARRPLFTALDCTRIEDRFDLQLPDWKEVLQLAMETGT